MRVRLTHCVSVCICLCLCGVQGMIQEKDQAFAEAVVSYERAWKLQNESNFKCAAVLSRSRCTPISLLTRRWVRVQCGVQVRTHAREVEALRGGASCGACALAIGV